MPRKKAEGKKTKVKTPDKPGAAVPATVVIRRPDVCSYCKAKDSLSTYKTRRHTGFTDRRRVCGVCGHRVVERTDDV